MQDIPILEDDGLFTPEVGEWSRDKHHFLSRYLNAFTTAMSNKTWKSLYYIDLFAGAGIEKIKETGLLDWGSPLLAAQAKRKFGRLHLCEKKLRNYYYYARNEVLVTAKSPLKRA